MSRGGAAITSATIQALETIRTIHLSSDAAAAESKAQRISKALDQQLADRKSIGDRISQSFTQYARSSFESKKSIAILTLSSSSTISACLAHAMSTLGGVGLDLRILESRPLFEGDSPTACKQ